MVQVPADEWAHTSRRLVYLETLLIQCLRGHDQIKEWYDARELAALRLPGLPQNKAAITRRARTGGWLRREVVGHGNVRLQYHCSGLPQRAFDALIGRMLDISNHAGKAIAPPIPYMEQPPDPEPVQENTAPPWVLPFMRLLKGGADGDVSTAWRELPNHLPADIEPPTREEAAETIMRLGLLKEFSG